jgi:carboxypeptidase Taq
VTGATAWGELERRMRELAELGRVAALLSWDQQTMMPPGGSEGRARALATMRVLRHQRLVDPRLGELLDQLGDGGLDPERAAMVRIMARAHGRAARLPDDLVRRISVTGTRGNAAWKRARAAGDFTILQPHFTEMVVLKREQADLIGHDGERYDALLDAFEPDMRTARLVPLFAELRRDLAELLAAIRAAPPPPDPPFTGRFPAERQIAFTERVLADLGFDLEAGRQDISAHPFSTTIALRDVRVTTRVYEDDPFSAVFSTIHEAGHGMYDQGFDPRFEDLPLASAPSLGAHESQSRLWENIVGRSRPFWDHYTPLLRETLGPALGGMDAEAVHRHINRVQPSLIRVEADEVTYNLHILIRFELELRLLRGELDVADLPEAWDAAYDEHLGVRPPDASDGVLQDIHWSEGSIGYFPTYTLGNLYAAMLWRRLAADVPDVDAAIGEARFAPILDWLREHVHRPGHLLECEPLMQRVTGESLSHRPFMDYLWGKFGPLYGVSRS